jgi:hypothetical protein
MKQPSSEISIGRRCGLWLAAWVVALAITMPNPKAVALVWVFPFGLLRLIGWRFDRYVAALVVGWLPYTLLTIAALATRQRKTYFVIYGILCATLLINAVSCNMMLRELGNAR